MSQHQQQREVSNPGWQKWGQQIEQNQQYIYNRYKHIPNSILSSQYTEIEYHVTQNNPNYKGLVFKLIL